MTPLTKPPLFDQSLFLAEGSCSCWVAYCLGQLLYYVFFKLLFYTFKTLVKKLFYETKGVFLFPFLSQSLRQVLTFWLVCLCCSSWLVFYHTACTYLCMFAQCVDYVRVHSHVCYCWCCCCRNILWSDLCDILPCCWIRWQAECISSARRWHSVLFRLSATSALSLYSNWSHGLTSEFGSLSPAHHSFTIRGLCLFQWAE